MIKLLAKTLDAHGGVDRWRQYSRVDATIVSGGASLHWIARVRLGEVRRVGRGRSQDINVWGCCEAQS
jgi:hypothetical protein